MLVCPNNPTYNCAEGNWTDSKITARAVLSNSTGDVLCSPAKIGRSATHRCSRRDVFYAAKTLQRRLGWTCDVGHESFTSGNGRAWYEHEERNWKHSAHNNSLNKSLPFAEHILEHVTDKHKAYMWLHRGVVVDQVHIIGAGAVWCCNPCSSSGAGGFRLWVGACFWRTSLGFPSGFEPRTDYGTSVRRERAAAKGDTFILATRLPPGLRRQLHEQWRQDTFPRIIFLVPVLLLRRPQRVSCYFRSRRAPLTRLCCSHRRSKTHRSQHLPTIFSIAVTGIVFGIPNIRGNVESRGAGIQTATDSIWIEEGSGALLSGRLIKESCVPVWALSEKILWCGVSLPGPCPFAGLVLAVLFPFPGRVLARRVSSSGSVDRQKLLQLAIQCRPNSMMFVVMSAQRRQTSAFEMLLWYIRRKIDDKTKPFWRATWPQNWQ